MAEILRFDEHKVTASRLGGGVTLLSLMVSSDGYLVEKIALLQSALNLAGPIGAEAPAHWLELQAATQNCVKVYRQARLMMAGAIGKLPHLTSEDAVAAGSSLPWVIEAERRLNEAQWRSLIEMCESR